MDVFIEPENSKIYASSVEDSEICSSSIDQNITQYLTFDDERGA